MIVHLNVCANGATNGDLNVRLLLLNEGRYDQSALNLILAREFGPEVAMIVRNTTLSDSIWVIMLYAELTAASLWAFVFALLLVAFRAVSFEDI